MFGDQFYPTPSATVYKMIKGLDWPGKRILDPSAGDGAILDILKNSSYRVDTYAIEIDPALRAILADKGHKVIDSDFLDYSGNHYFDFILMNPPFKAGVKHLLKAWEIANGATIRCLLNSASLTNPNSMDRERLLHLIDQYGEVEHLGPIFANGARRTADVNVSMVTLIDTRKQEKFRIGFDPEQVGQTGFEIPDIEANELAPGDAFDSYEARFNAALTAFKKLLVAANEVRYYTADLFPAYNSQDPMTEALSKRGADESYSAFLGEITRLAWDNLFQKTKLANVTTENVRKQIEDQQKAQGTMAFTAQNMHDLFFGLMTNKEEIMTQCILEVFDNLTQYYDGNREYLEGWKSNSGYVVGSRFILPHVGSMWGAGLDYRRKEEIVDIERACCFLTGKKLEEITSIADVYNHESHYGDRMVSEFFETRLFKKRTMHFWWRDDELRDRFNAVVAKERWGWLPEKVKQGVYK